MEEFIQRMRRLLQDQFAGGEVDLEERGSGRISGFLIWSGFEALEQIERQRQLWRVLRAHLDAGDQLKVVAILTLTPEEMAAAREG
jgi:acid stress-induced BolA-like protein IbaG/YrbA